jgi:L-ascorbate metabolism protein UlaG (beta-lactamase superfamily)
MKLTKYGHACVFIESGDGKRLIIDPGEFTELPDGLGGVIAVVCTHVHGDHTDARNIQKIVDANPDVVVIANDESMKVLDAVSCKKEIITSQRTKEIAGFTLAFYPLDHAVIWQGSPCKNLAVKVNDFYYHSGDSFFVIDERVNIAGVPVSGPWLKMGEAIQFVHEVKADIVVPIHNGLLNDAGHENAHKWLKNTMGDTQKELILLQNGESVEKR